MPYNLLEKKFGTLFDEVNQLLSAYTAERIDPKEASMFDALVGTVFGPKHINADRVNAIEFSQNIAKPMLDVYNVLLAQSDSSAMDKATCAENTRLFLKRALAGSLLLDVLEIQSSYYLRSPKNSDLVKLILTIFDINDINEIPAQELRDNFEALERYMAIAQNQKPEKAIVWHPVKSQDMLIEAIKKYTPEYTNVVVTEAGMVI